jgi:hypothetical protein
MLAEVELTGVITDDDGIGQKAMRLDAAPQGAKLSIAFWDYLGSRLAVPNHSEIPYLPTIVRHRCATA